MNTDGLENYISLESTTGILKLAKDIKEFAGKKIKVKINNI